MKHSSSVADKYTQTPCPMRLAYTSLSLMTHPLPTPFSQNMKKNSTLFQTKTAWESPYTVSKSLNVNKFTSHQVTSIFLLENLATPPRVYEAPSIRFSHSGRLTSI